VVEYRIWFKVKHTNGMLRETHEVLVAISGMFEGELVID
jgi:hypothetical protein